jgi:hypothetical protein
MSVKSKKHFISLHERIEKRAQKKKKESHDDQQEQKQN